MRTTRSPRTVFCLGLILLAIVWSRPGGSAEIRSSSGSASSNTYTPGAAYSKKIPGSTQKIQGSRPRTYIKPQKMSYQQHLESLSSHRFKNDSSSFGSRTGRPSATHTNRSPNSVQPPSSRIHIQKKIGHPSGGITRNEPLSNGDLVFLAKLTETIHAKDPAAGSRLAQITSSQKQGRTLSRDEYDFLNGIAKKIGNGQAAFRLHSIADRRREIIR